MTELKTKDWPQVIALKGIWRSSSLLRDHHKLITSKFGLTLPEFDLIAALGNTEGIRMSDLAQEMITTASNLTRVCQKLEKQGLVERTRSNQSDREVIAKLTKKGVLLFDQAFLPVGTFTCMVMDQLISESEQKTLGKILLKLCNNAEKLNTTSLAHDAMSHKK